jgi:NhaP-type Na+/H+ or K+/H+ antiporter
MESVSIWFVVAGALFISMALAGSMIARLPLTPAMLYLGIGMLLGPQVSGLVRADALTHAPVLERMAEIAVIVSLFTAGLKLRVPVLDRRWLLAVRLATLSMAVTVALVATAVVVGLGFPWGIGIIIGAVLAPTDPVLASDVQVEHPFDEDRLRFGLTGEASLNDGTAFPFLMLGLGLLGLHDLGDGLWRWVAVDVLWATAAGLAIGGALGTGVGQLVLYLRRTHKEAVGLDDFLALGLIALAYGIALVCHAYGFLAVFAAGLALRRVERLASGLERKPVVETLEHSGQATNTTEELATDPENAPAYMAHAVLTFNEQLERIGEVVIVLVVGAMLSSSDLLSWNVLWLVPLLFLAIRPVSVAIGLVGSDSSRREHGLIGWFGIRGIGSVYYLMFALNRGLPDAFTKPVIGFTLSIIACSIVVHGVTVTPLMNRWGRKSDTAAGTT